ncbi:hypothetical protein Pmar_PMAR002142 [Perkinsus marinus ATCC 50983]|uniref:Uncharacterized protein n=2 Tax=Perkinsus marinus TaxID=31276 RepID=C5KP86_PERM5|nr:hypothetical protein Pmar_PMAR002142 [Perkinsus marinus ATCC 50983]ABV22191.1 unknown [Perkinsus marinus]ABV22194.1 unknown [Perkinsus marinus]EER13693.1 hypothetical protein Pmar_PMAR002142 [Perkinsus marinus ATCC 50983]|eukprot:XP_002781898.1 hypothetical protein Pmar_PMAR002142 [Perkinsus marinus ATCC 50983]
MHCGKMPTTANALGLTPLRGDCDPLPIFEDQDPSLLEGQRRHLNEMSANLIQNMSLEKASAADIRRARNLTLLSELYEEAAVAYDDGDKKKLLDLIATAEDLVGSGSLYDRQPSDDIVTVDSMRVLPEADH